MEIVAESTIPERVLAIVAHQDDIEFGIAGSVAHWKAQGADVVYAILTDGSSGSDEIGTDPVILALIREQEQLAAARTLGVTDVRFFGVKDGQLEATLDLRREVVKLIREIKPDRIVCQDPTTLYRSSYYINHPDHRAAGQVVLDAIFPASQSPLIFPELMEQGYMPHKVKEVYVMLTNEPDTYVDITHTVDQKIKALMCHKSQIDGRAADWIQDRNGQAGELVGVKYAELYKVMRINQQRIGNNPGEEGEK